MIRKFLLAAALLFLTAPAFAQNPMCPTRPTGDNSNACASTAFVNNEIAATIVGTCTIADNVGFINDGVTANDAAFDTWWANLSSTGGCLEFGKGRYAFSVAVNKTMATALQSVTIRGLGSDVSQLYWAGGGGLKITQGNPLNSVHIRDLSLVTGAVNTGSGLWLNSTQVLASAVQSDVTNVQLRGSDWDDINANTNYWATGLNILGWSNVVVQNINTYGLIPTAAGGGIGVQIGGAGTVPTIIISFYNSSFFAHTVGTQLNSFWEGISFYNCNWQFQEGTFGLSVPAAQTHTGPLLNIVNSQFDSGGNQINLASTVTQLVMTGNTINVVGNNTFGLRSVGGTNPIIVGNEFTSAGGTGGTAVFFSGTNGSITGNGFTGMATGIDITGATNVTVNPNNYASSVTTQITNPGGTANNVIEFGTGGNVIYTQNTTANRLMLGGGTTVQPSALGAGTTTTVLHGNAGGAPTFAAVANADLVNSATTVNGQTCTLGSSCTVTASAASTTVGTTTVLSGTSHGVLTNNAGVLGNTAAGTNGQLFLGVTSAEPAFASMSGDATITNAGVLTFTSVISAGGPTGSATVAPIITYDAKGRLTTVSSATITPAVGSITGFGTGVGAALAINIGSVGAPVLFNGAGGTPTSITLTNATGTAASLTAGNATNTTITDDTTTAATMYLTWVTATTGNLPQKISSTKLSWIPSSGTLGVSVLSATTVAANTYSNVQLTQPASTAVLTLASGKTITINNTLTLSGTDGTTMAFPTTTATIARTDAAQTFTGTQTFATIAAAGALTLQSNGSTQAGAIDTSQQWVIGPATTALSGTRLLVTNNSGTAPNPGFAPTMEIVGADAAQGGLGIFTFQTGASQAFINYFKARGTAATPTAVSSGDRLGSNFAYGYATSGGAGYVGGAGFVMTATNNFTSTVAGTRLDLQATPTGTAAAATGASVGDGFMVGTTTDPGAGKISFTNGITANGNAGITTVCTIAVGNVLTFTLGILTAKGGVAGCT